MRRQPPPAAGGLVDGPAHQRMAKDELARDVGRTDEVAVDQVVERREPLVLRELGDRGGEVGFEGLAGHRRAVQQRPRRERQGLELLGERGRDRRGTPPSFAPAPFPACLSAPDSRPASLARAELLEIERVATPVAIDLGDRPGVDLGQELGRLRLAELAELHPRHAGRRKGRRQPLGRLTRAEREGQQRRGHRVRAAAVRPPARSMRDRPSGGRRARPPAAGPRRAPPAGRAPPGGRGSARRPPRSRAPRRPCGPMAARLRARSAARGPTHRSRMGRTTRCGHPRRPPRHRTARLARTRPPCPRAPDSHDPRLWRAARRAAGFCLSPARPPRTRRRATPSPRAASAPSSRSSSDSRPTVSADPRATETSLHLPRIWL